MLTEGNIKSQSNAQIGWALVVLYVIFVIFGVMNVYSATYTPEYPDLLDFSRFGGKQLLFAVIGAVLIFVVMLLDLGLYERLAWFIYVFSIILLLGLPIFGSEVKGNRAWYNLGFVSFQPSEIAKFATALALSSYLSSYKVSMSKIQDLIIASVIILLPMILVLTHDTGSALVFVSFFLVLYLAGAHGIYFAIGIILALIFIMDVFFQHYSVDPHIVFWIVGGIALLICVVRLFRHKGIWNVIMSTAVILGFFAMVHFYVWENVFKDYQRQRILTSFKLIEDNKGIGFNTYQSEIAIGSGGFLGKGFLDGSQTKGNFVPEQHTDFIFSTLGEEWGFVGAALIVILYAAFLIKIVRVASRQRTYFARNYAWCVFSLFFFHFMVNIAMAIGIMPVIGIPLPFFSYGGSSLWSFTVLLFVLIKMDAHRKDFLPEINNFTER
ncbi:MAG: rod shape-determining protein RodA [Flavobacteriales bacterium]|nr:rod shape-determining protein RodA [Flavobacteriales bacterium]